MRLQRTLLTASTLAIAAVLGWHAPAQGQFMACAADKERLCPDVALGGGRVMACLRTHESELTEGCRKALGLPEHAAAPAGDDTREECRGDVLKFCRLAIGDRAKVKACMREHAADLSDGCKTALIAHGQ